MTHHAFSKDLPAFNEHVFYYLMTSKPHFSALSVVQAPIQISQLVKLIMHQIKDIVISQSKLGNDTVCLDQLDSIYPLPLQRRLWYLRLLVSMYFYWPRLFHCLSRDKRVGLEVGTCSS